MSNIIKALTETVRGRVIGESSRWLINGYSRAKHMTTAIAL